MSGTEESHALTLENLIQRIRAFNTDRDWGQYHSPKNLAMSLVIEAAELAEVFQWLTEEESARLTEGKRQHAEEEIGDVFLYLLNLADKLGIDPLEAARKKLELNGEKYPVHRSRGSAEKYTEFK
jgi:NTP pyrophosphatase (non-canonical NTP hydrolase)